MTAQTQQSGSPPAPSRDLPKPPTQGRDVSKLDLPYSLEMVPTDKIFLDKYQRASIAPQLKRMDADFDVELFIPLLVSERQGGRYAAFDGGHRLKTAEKKGYKEVPCLVYRGLTPQQESTLFSRLQRERRNISAADRFKAELLGDPDRPETKMAHSIEDIVEGLGFTVGSIRKDGMTPIASPSALEQIWRSRKGPGEIEGPDALKEALSMIARAWGGTEHRATDADLIKGMGLLFLRHANKIDKEQLVERLREVTPGIILGRAQESRTGRGGGGASYAVYRTLVQQYNRGRSGKRVRQPPSPRKGGSEDIKS